jgi:hypothetical protein
MSSENFFIQSGLSFLKEYGEAFHVFDMFSNPNNVLIKETVNKKEAFNYSLRNYSQYFDWIMPQVDEIHPYLSNDSSFYPLINSHVGKSNYICMLYCIFTE